MSLSLDLGFEFYRSEPDAIRAWNRLAFTSPDKDLAAALDLIAFPLKGGVHWLHDEEGSTLDAEDGYGNPITFVLAGHLAPKLEACAADPWDKAVVAFVSALPVETRVVLRWH